MESESPMPLDSVDSLEDVEQREPVRRDDDEESNDSDCDDINAS